MYYGLINSMSKGSAYTARTSAFATATGITDATILGALNTFDLGLISNSLDTKMKALYPMVGGTATTHKFNFMNPVDSNSAYRLVFSGGGTHSSNGYQPNGTNATADTFYNPSTTGLSVNSNHLSVYSRTQTSAPCVDIGQTNNNWLSAIQFVGSNYIYNPNNSYTITTTETASINLSINTRRSSTDFAFFKNNVKVGTNTTTNSSSFTSANVHIASAGGASLFSPREVAFASIGDGLNDSQCGILYSLVNSLQTSLSRNV
jgi:hypothetical protein